MGICAFKRRPTGTLIGTLKGILWPCLSLIAHCSNVWGSLSALHDTRHRPRSYQGYQRLLLEDGYNIVSCTVPSYSDKPLVVRDLSVGHCVTLISSYLRQGTRNEDYSSHSPPRLRPQIRRLTGQVTQSCGLAALAMQ